MIVRRASRVLLVDAGNRVLLFRGADPAVPDDKYWFTPGGGRDGDEPATMAAARELAEETGLVLTPDEFGAPVYSDVTEFDFDHENYQQEQDFFLVRVPRWQVVTDGFDAVEQAFIDEYRWWTIEELETTVEPFHPVVLPELLRRVLPC